MDVMKTCVRCHAVKPVGKFYRNRKAKDGRQSCCTDCSKAQIREWEAKNPERLAAKREQNLAEPVDPTATKHCRGCDQDKPLLAFHAHRATRDHRATYCKKCAQEYDREVRATQRQAYSRSYTLKVTTEQYRAMFDFQGGRCAICGREGPPPGQSTRNGSRRTRSLAVDHDHATGKIRSLLCTGCNGGIGLLGDDPDRLRAAADYLDGHRVSPDPC